jgi:hypothetical protein
MLTHRLLLLLLDAADTRPSIPMRTPGRYVATAVMSLHQMENGFNMWSFNGKLLYA